MPPIDLFNGAKNIPGNPGDMRRICLARHSLNISATTSNGNPIPGVINMAFADGHTALWKLQDIKNVASYNGCKPIADPWATTPAL
jgi:prepilin-type processing-associated H-X9-DG protein